MLILVSILALLFTAVPSFSMQTTSESVNPFNQFMSPSGGVSLYSGDAALSIPIASVSGLGGVNINLALSYSSNMMLNARARK